MLSDKQQHDFWQDGVVTIDGVFTSDEVVELKTAVDLLSDELKEEGSDEIAVHLQDVTTKHQIFRSLAKSKQITKGPAPVTERSNSDWTQSWITN